jgi:hypothetical protein
MQKIIQHSLLGAGIIGLIFAVIFYLDAALDLRWPLVRDFWPWVGSYSRLSNLSLFFIASVFGAFAGALIWVGLSGEIRAVEGGALDIIIISGGSLMFVLQSYLADNAQNNRLLVAAVLCGAACLISIALFLYIRRVPFQAYQPTPKSVHISFGVFSVLLLLAGALLVFKVPNVFPWPLRPEVSVIYGWVFLGTFAYYLHGFLRPRWQNACGQLLGFLGYDLVLIIPFINHLGAARPENRLSLIVYIAVLVFSAGLAVFYCFVHPATRLWSATIISKPSLSDA